MHLTYSVSAPTLIVLKMSSTQHYLLSLLCPGSGFNLKETISTNNPVFSPCEYNILLYSPLIAFIVIWSPLRAIHLAFYRERYSDPIAPCSLTFTIQLSLWISLLLISLLQLIISAYASNWCLADVPPVILVTCFSKVTAFSIAVLWTLRQRSIRIYTSSSLSILSLYYFICSTFHFTLTFTQRETFIQLELYTVYAQFALSLVTVVSQSLSTAQSSESIARKNDARVRHYHPMIHASYFSRVTFQWANSLVILGWRRDLIVDDLHVTRPEYRASFVCNHVSGIWDKLYRVSKGTKSRAVHSNGSAADEKKVSINSAPKDVKHGNVFIALVRAYGMDYLHAVIAGCAVDVCILVTPVLLKALLAYLEKSNEIIIWHGYFLILGFFSATVVEGLIQSYFSYKTLNLAVVIHTTLVSMIYRKSLRITNASRNKSTVGEIVNLMSVDADRFNHLMRFGETFLSAPIRVIVSIYFIYQDLGISVFAGVAVIILLIPITTLASKKMQKLQAAQMGKKDERIKLVSEILSGIKVIKLYAWETSFTRLIKDIRKIELSRLRAMAYLEAVTAFVFTSTPMLVSLVTFATYTLIDSSHQLNAEKAFVSLAYFNIMRLPLTDFPHMVSHAMMIAVSIKRINKFLNLPELHPYIAHQEDEFAVRMTDCHLIHENVDDKVSDASDCNGDAKKGKVSDDAPGQPFELRGINMKIKKGSLVAIVGTVGSGKSSLVSALLGEMELVSGCVNIAPDSSTGKETSIAYVPQQAWIQNNTIKNNILFGEEYDEAKYRKIISSCQLVPDLQILASGDATEIGEKGINMSGGQKQRLSLARACYSDAQMYILDDPLSAVDAHVAKNLYNQVLSTRTGLLGKKTRILVTNDLSLLPKVDNIFVISNGTISESGDYEQLMASDGTFSEFVQEYANRERTRSSMSEHAGSASRSSSQSSAVRGKSLSGETANSAKLIEDETMNTGGVKFSVYLSFVKRISLVSVFIFFIISMQLFDAGANYWLSLWASDGVNSSLELMTLRLSVYSGLGIGQVVSIVIASLVFARGSMICASKLHTSLLNGVIRAPMSFFDTTPMGRIVNRFSKDIDVIDESLPTFFFYWCQILVQATAIFFVVISVTPWFIVLIVPVAIVYFCLQRVYIPTNRQLRRIESVTRSPLYSNFSETLTGIAIIRAYRAQSRFIADSDAKLDKTQRASFCSVYSENWLSVRLQFIGNCVVAAAALFAIVDRDTVSPALAGLSITYASSITQILTWLVMITAVLETDIIAVERILEYADGLKCEAEWRSHGSHKPPDGWPTRGTIEFKSYSTRYRENLPLVLDDIVLRIGAGEHVGIVGRTGAGKSSVTLALFRLIEPANGTILIDAIDITKIGLHELREAITIIPQDPVLFSGKLRINLDPFGRFTDEQLWRALQLAHLKEFACGLDGGLDYYISEGGCNLSVGQRQLICLARALLKNTKILILDEATAAVDMQTDSLIQSTVRNEFSRCTILTIAHRLNTILDSDKILVLDEGHVAEFAPPQTLLADHGSKFHALAKDAGIV